MVFCGLGKCGVSIPAPLEAQDARPKPQEGALGLSPGGKGHRCPRLAPIFRTDRAHRLTTFGPSVVGLHIRRPWDPDVVRKHRLPVTWYGT